MPSADAFYDYAPAARRQRRVQQFSRGLYVNRQNIDTRQRVTDPQTGPAHRELFDEHPAAVHKSEFAELGGVEAVELIAVNFAHMSGGIERFMEHHHHAELAGFRS